MKIQRAAYKYGMFHVYAGLNYVIESLHICNTQYLQVPTTDTRKDELTDHNEIWKIFLDKIFTMEYGSFS